MKIFLIGMPGTGKSTVGKILANKLGWKFMDLDHYIEERELMFIDHIITLYGEDAFRVMETNALKSINEESMVISTGGGIVTRKENKQFMNGIKIYLETPIELIEQRLKDSYERPLLKEKSLQQIYDERFLKYQGFADHIISNSKEVSRTVENILSLLKEMNIL